MGVICMAKAKYTQWITPDGLLRVAGWARDGLTNEQIAHNMGINRDTLRVWERNFSGIADALKNGKDVADRKVENALFNKATGNYWTEEIIEELQEDGTMAVVEHKKRRGTPDTTAQIFWLKNRKPDEWRDKREHKSGGPQSNDGFIEALSSTAEDDWKDGDDNG